MINKHSILLGLMALVSCVPRTQAQEFSLGTLAAGPGRVSAIGEPLPPSPGKPAVVGTLPKDYFRSAPAQAPAPDVVEASSSHTTANMLVITALAAMLCVGMTITGLCILRRRPHSTPSRILLST